MVWTIEGMKLGDALRIVRLCTCRIRGSRETTQQLQNDWSSIEHGHGIDDGFDSFLSIPNSSPEAVVGHLSSGCLTRLQDPYAYAVSGELGLRRPCRRAARRARAR